MSSPPVFIVGVQRSGTTLLAAMLAAQSNMSCGPETHFFRRLSQVDPEVLCSRESWPEKALEFLLSIEHSSFKDFEGKLLVEKYEVAASELREYLQNLEPSVPAILASITEHYMSRMGKRRWVEKTPDHILHVSSIRRYFPTSPIVRIVRDPRDVALSLSRVPWGSKSWLEGLLYWIRVDAASDEFFRKDSLSHTLRFEDLVEDPRQVLRSLCRFIGEEFEEVMIDTSETGRLVNIRNAPWKAKASQPLDRGRVQVWREALSGNEKELAEAIAGDRLDRHGYPRERDFPALAEVYPESPLPLKYAALLGPVAASGVRFWRANSVEKPAVSVFIGDPEKDRWFEGGKWAKLARALILSARIVGSALSKRTLYWVADEDWGEWSGYCGFLIKRLLSRFRVTTPVPISEAANSN